MKLILHLVALFSCFVSVAQVAPPLTISVQGTVWEDAGVSPNGIRDGGEKAIAGVLVELFDADTDELVASDICNANGEFNLEVEKPGQFYVQYTYPLSGYKLTTQRVGGNNLINSAASASGWGGEIRSALFNMESNSTTHEYGIGLIALPNTKTYFTNIDRTPTTWTKSVSLPKAGTIGTLIGAEFFVNAAVFHPVISILNAGTGDAEVEMGVKGLLDINRTGNTWLPRVINLSSQPMDIMEPLESAETIYRYNFPGSDTYASGPMNYALFQGEGVFNVNNIVGRGTYTVYGGTGNSVAVVSTNLGAGFFVVYKYEEGSLPVNLVSFKVELNKVEEASGVKLKWNTVTESNSSHFDVERSEDGISWTRIGTVSSHQESTTTKEYSLLDSNPSNGINYYRLKMIDLDDTYEYSRIESIRVNVDLDMSYIYPNPIVDIIHVKSINWKVVDRIKVLDLKGKVMYQGPGNNGVNGIQVQGLAKGIYILNITLKDGTFKNYKANIL
jgi:hypothetical protein